MLLAKIMLKECLAKRRSVTYTVEYGDDDYGGCGSCGGDTSTVEDTSDTTTAVFEWLFFIFDFNKDFDGFTTVLPKGTDGDYGQLVKLENP